MLNLNPVVGSKNFQYRVETFFTKVLLTNPEPISKIVYYSLTAQFCLLLVLLCSHPMQDQNAGYKA